MRTYKTGVVGGVLAGACALVLLAGFSAQDEAYAGKGEAGLKNKVAYTSVEAAYRTGIGAYHLGRMKIALHALEYAAENNSIPATLWLARIYSGASVGLKPVARNDAKAFEFYQKVASQLIDVKHYDRNVAPVAAEAFIGVAQYYKRGIPALGIKSNAEEAVRLYMHAANNLQNPVAEYLLARAFMTGEGIHKSRRNAYRWFMKAAAKNYAPAQATIGNMFWRGEGVKRNKARGLALLKLARHNAEKRDVEWISELHQQVSVVSNQELMSKADLYITSWEQRFGTTRKGSVFVVNPARPDGMNTGFGNTEMAQDDQLPDIRIQDMRHNKGIAPANVTDGMQGGYRKLKPVNVITDQ